MLDDSWPLIGRDVEFGRLCAALDSGRGAVVSGDPGVGKTRLVQELLGVAQDAGFAVEAMRATAATRQIALGVFLPVLDGVGGVDGREDVVHRAFDLLGGRARSQPLVVSVDDGHLLDDLSIALISMLATNSSARVYVTVRKEEAPPPGLVDLWKDRVVERIEVEPLGRADTERLIEAALGDLPAVSVVERIWELTRGNALFIRELIAAAVERRERGVKGAPVQMPSEANPTERLRELVDERLRLLDSDERETLDLIAVGERIPMALVEELADVRVVAVLERRGLLRSGGDARHAWIEVAHPLHGEVLRGGLPSIERRAVLRRLLKAGSASGVNDPVRLAVWTLEAGLEGDVDALVDAAREAGARFDHELAERLSRSALESGAEEALLTLGEALAGQGRSDEAEDIFARVEPGSAEEASRVAIARARNLFWGLERDAEAIAVLAEAERRAGADDAWRLESSSLRAQFLVYTARTDEAQRLIDEIREHPRARVAAKVRAVTAAVPLWAAAGGGDRAGIASQWYERARQCRSEVPYGELQLRMVSALAMVWTGHLRDADAFVRRDLDLSFGSVPAPLRGILESLRGGVAFTRGWTRDAEHHLRSGVRAFTEGDWFSLRHWASAFLARALAFNGDAEAGRAVLEKAEAALLADMRRGAFALPDIQMSRAWLLAADGAREEAIELFLTVAGLVEPIHRPLHADALHAVARLGEAGRVAAPLDRVARVCDGPLVGAYARHAEALEESDGRALREVAAEFERIGADLLAAEALRSAARCFRSQGRGGSAVEASRGGSVLLDRCGRPRSPALEPEAAAADELTDREREVATLAARGLSSAEIADRLFVSVRTVDTHLYRVYRKLAVDGRGALADALGLADP